MSVITLALVKKDLRVTQSEDDTLIQILIDASKDEALRFLNRTELPTLPVDYPTESSETYSEDIPSSEDPIVPSVYAAVFLLVKAKYEETDPVKVMAWRTCAETLLMPYRTEMGV